MPEKYEVLLKAYDKMICLASESRGRLLEAKTTEEINIHYAQHEAFIKAAEAIREQMKEVLK